MLFVNNNCGKGNRTVTSDTFVSKYMVNVNAYHKEGFYFICCGTIRERPPCAVLPTPRFYRGIGLVLELFRGEKLAVAGCVFVGFFLSICRYFWLSFKSGGVMCYIKSRHILRHVINTVNSQCKPA